MFCSIQLSVTKAIFFVARFAITGFDFSIDANPHRGRNPFPPLSLRSNFEHDIQACIHLHSRLFSVIEVLFCAYQTWRRMSRETINARLTMTTAQCLTFFRSTSQVSFFCWLVSVRYAEQGVDFCSILFLFQLAATIRYAMNPPVNLLYYSIINLLFKCCRRWQVICDCSWKRKLIAVFCWSLNLALQICW